MGLWPTDAFVNGVEKMAQKIPKFFIALNNIDVNFDVNDQENKEFMLTQYRISPRKTKNC